jgi:replicative DNA helicase
MESNISFKLDDITSADRFSEREINNSNIEPAVRGGRVPPHSLDAEIAVIGAVLLDNESLNTIVEILQADDFYKSSHKYLFEAIISLYERRDPIDVVSLSNELRAISKIDEAGGVDYISYILDVVPTVANTQYYARIVKEMSLRRKIIHAVTEIANDAFESQGDIGSFIDSVEQRIFQVSESRLTQGFSKVGDLVKDSIRRVEQLCTSDDHITGVRTGFTALDEMTSGLQASDLIIIAGRPSMGKTALALSIARNAALDYGQAVAVFSLEMSKEQITTRLLCSEAKVSSAKVRSGNLTDNDFPRIVDAASKIAQANIFIDDTPAITALEMRAKARRLHRETPLSLIIIDYLQLMQGNSRRSERREQEISDISRSIKALAKELKIPIIALSQLNRAVETRVDKRPLMADLRESGAIEQDADIIGFVYRDEVYHPDTQHKGVAEIIISKHRNGSIGTIQTAFVGEYTSFENLAPAASYDYLGGDINLGSDDDDDLI